MNINISKMTISDFEQISPILNHEFDDFWTTSTLKSELENPNSTYLVVKEDDKIVAFGGIWRAVDEVHITDIVTRKAFRSKGIGSLLLEKLIELAREEKYIYITLEVNEENTIAQKLYLNYNFKEVGFRKNYYGQNKNAIIMTLNLMYNV